MTFLQVQLAVIAMFFHYNLDEIVVARTAAGLSFRNPVERVHAIANLGLQGIGLMRKEMNSEMENIIGKYNSNAEIRKVCEDNQVFQQSFGKSIAPAKELIEEVFQRISLKENPFKLYPPAEDKEITDIKGVIAEKFGTCPSSAESGPVA